MAKKTKTTRTRKAATGFNGSAKGKHLVIVESPAKARTINKYLGRDYLVMASVGHVRDLPNRNPKGVKNPVPGVDLEHNFQPTYDVISGKEKTVRELKKAARDAEDVYLATDLDREGEAIAWHLAEALRVPEDQAKRVVFNAITKDEIHRAFQTPRHIDRDKVNAQQARRILDRIVGYQVSPLLWKKVAGGLSAGRVQSVAVRLIAERERDILAFIPEEYWKLTAYLTTDLDKTPALREAWAKFLAQAPEGKSRTQRDRNAWLTDHHGLVAELLEVDGDRFNATNADQALKAAQAVGLQLDEKRVTEDPKAKGPAQHKVELIGHLPPQDQPGAPEWRIASIDTKRTRSRPSAPFITSTLQQTAANRYSFAAASTMRIAQQLYEGVDVQGMGSVGLITYMRTDSTQLSGEALRMARNYIGQHFGDKYLPDKPNFYGSSNKSAQEAHEAIRPTDVNLTPERLRASLDDRQYKLYRLIWERFVACQMTPAEWDATTVLIDVRNNSHKATFKATGRMLAFDGFYKVTGLPNTSDELTLPRLEENQDLGPIQVDPTQHFTSPPPRYTEASLVKKLESEGIGRPSTYASIIQVIQDRKYVEKLEGRFHATDMGLVVTDKLVEAFPRIMDIGYTRQMESELDAIEDQHHDWVEMLKKFYGPFRDNLEKAYEGLTHAKAETEPAPYKCPQCDAQTVYRFGRNGRFLSCSRYPECKYAAPVDRQGRPQAPEQTEVACPECSQPMLLRKGRFGPFLSCSRYPDCQGIVNLDRKGQVVPPKVPPLATDLPCPKCEAPLNLRSSKRGPWLSCSKFPKCRGRESWTKLDEKVQEKWASALEEHEKANPQPIIRTIHGQPVGEEYVPKVIGGGDNQPTPTDDGESYE